MAVIEVTMTKMHIMTNTTVALIGTQEDIMMNFSLMAINRHNRLVMTIRDMVTVVSIVVDLVMTTMIMIATVNIPTQPAPHQPQTQELINLQESSTKDLVQAVVPVVMSNPPYIPVIPDISHMTSPIHMIISMVLQNHLHPNA
jgi:hypothetical protein